MNVNKEQIIKEFSQLYIGQNPGQLAEQYFQRKRKEMLLIIASAVFIVIVCGIGAVLNSKVENNIINRKEGKSTKEEIRLQMKTEGENWQDIILELYPKEYSEEELDRMFLEVCEKLPVLICMENENLQSICSDLNLVQEISGYPFFIRWESSENSVIDEEGKLSWEEEVADEEVELTAIFTYNDWEKVYTIPVRIQMKREKNLVSSLKEDLQQQEEETRKEAFFCLPTLFMENSLEWRYSLDNTYLALGLLFVFLIPLISYLKDREIYNQSGKRKHQLQESFPDFISRLILLMEAGLNIQGAFFRIGEDYLKKREGKQDYLYEEIIYICRQMKNGLTEKEGYELLGKRCGLSCYKKLSGLLIQQLHKGGNGILESLKEEATKAGDEQKRNIQKKGEEMGTKLLFPMILMLAIVMIFIMVPALFSFQV